MTDIAPHHEQPPTSLKKDSSTMAPPPPPPPPLPPMSASQLATLSLMEQKIPSAPRDAVSTLDDSLKAQPQAYEKVHYFFYGTLTELDTLSRILDSAVEASALKPAQTKGYSIEMWGQYKALVRGPTGAVVRGRAYEVLSQEHADRLAAYETNAYELAGCEIDMLDERGEVRERVRGRTFVYAGDGEALREGRFDRKLWAKNMDPVLARELGRRFGGVVG